MIRPPGSAADWLAALMASALARGMVGAFDTAIAETPEMTSAQAAHAALLVAREMAGRSLSAADVILYFRDFTDRLEIELAGENAPRTIQWETAVGGSNPFYIDAPDGAVYRFSGGDNGSWSRLR